MINSSNLLKKYNLKVTPQRIAIVEELYFNGHMNINDLNKKLLEKFPSISLATIYKNVNAMIDKIFLSEVKIPNAKSVYELIKEEHSHLICSSCGKIEDVSPNLSSLENLINSDFKIEKVSVVFSGICPKCSK